MIMTNHHLILKEEDYGALLKLSSWPSFRFSLLAWIAHHAACSANQYQSQERGGRADYTACGV
jgi:hypothetical protein